jgi:hypothetical protein
MRRAWWGRVVGSGNTNLGYKVLSVTQWDGFISLESVISGGWATSWHDTAMREKWSSRKIKRLQAIILVDY